MYGTGANAELPPWYVSRITPATFCGSIPCSRSERSKLSNECPACGSRRETGPARSRVEIHDPLLQLGNAARLLRAERAPVKRVLVDTITCFDRPPLFTP